MQFDGMRRISALAEDSPPSQHSYQSSYTPVCGDNSIDKVANHLISLMIYSIFCHDKEN